MTTGPPKNTNLNVDNNLKYYPNDKSVKVIIQKYTELKNGKIRLQEAPREPFPNHNTLAKFANIVYEDLNAKQVEIPKGWKHILTGTNDGNGYYGAMFINENEQQIVIAHRGTNSWRALKPDFDIVKNNISKHMLSAITFTDTIIQSFKSVEIIDQIIKSSLPGLTGNFYQVSCTGHSLGGWLAHLTTFTTKYLKNKGNIFVKDEDFENNYHIHSVGFDNPGCWEMLKKLKDDTAPYYDSNEYGDMNCLDINSFLSVPNRINSCNKHTGKLYHTVFNFEKGKIPVIHNHNIMSHAMENFVTYFENPRENPKIVKDWPHTEINASIILFDGIFFQSEYWKATRFSVDEEATEDKLYTLNVLTVKEQNFLSNLTSLKDEGYSRYEIRDEIPIFLKNYLENNLEKLLKLTITFEGIRVTCPTGIVDLKTAIRLTKEILFYCPALSNLIMEEVKNRPQAIKKFWKTISSNYMQSLSKLRGFNFLHELKSTDPEQTVNIPKFLLKESEQNLLIIQSCSGNLEMERLHAIIMQSNNSKIKESLIFLSWKRIQQIGADNSDALLNSELLVIYVLNNDIEDDTSDKVKNNFKLFLSKITKKAIIVHSGFDNFSNLIPSERTQEGVRNIVIKKVSLGDLAEDSEKKLLEETTVVFQGKQNITLMKLIEVSDENVKRSRKKFFYTQPLVDFVTGDCALYIGQDSSTYSTLGIRCEKLCKTIDNFENVFEYVSNSKKNELFLITGQTEEFQKHFTQFLVPSSKAFKDVKIKDVESGKGIIPILHITDDDFYSDDFKYVHLSKIILNKDKNEDGAEVFKAICEHSMGKEEFKDKTIFWLQFIENDNGVHKNAFVLQQVYNDQFYIQRKLMKKNVFNEKFAALFKDWCKNKRTKENIPRFVVKGGKENFKKYLKQQKVNISDEGISNVTDEKDRKEIQKPYHEIELFEKEEEEEEEKEEKRRKEKVLVCRWLNTEGSIKEIHPKVSLMDNNSKNWEEIDEFGDILSQRVVVIADDPGMGKTTFLTSFMEKLTDRGEWVIRMDLNSLHKYTGKDFEEIIKDIKKDISGGFTKPLTKLMLEADMDSAIFKNVYCIMDGFDEIRERDLRMTCLKVINHLKETTKIHFWVSVRNYMRHFVETELDTFSISIREIAEEDQENYLKRVWSIGCSFEENTKENEDQFDAKYAKETLDAAKKLFGKDTERFVGNPLHLRLLANALQDDVCKYMKQGSDVVFFNTVSQLYEKYLDTKFDIYFKEKSDIRKGYSLLIKTHIQSQLQEMAFKNRFPQEGQHIFGNKGYPEELVEEVYRVGLARTNNLKMELFHETFVDYYCSTLIVAWLNSDAKLPPSIDEFFIKKIFTEADYTYIRQFMNDQSSVFKNKIPIYDYLKKNTEGETLIHVIIKEGYGNILNYIFDCCQYGHENGTIIHKIVCMRNENGKAPLLLLHTKNAGQFMQKIHEINGIKVEETEEILMADMFRYQIPEENETILHKILSSRNENGETPLLLLHTTDSDQFKNKVLAEMNGMEVEKIEEILLATMFRCPNDGSNKTIQELGKNIEDSNYENVKNTLAALKEKKYWSSIDKFVKTLRDEESTLKKVQDKVEEMETEQRRKYLLLSRNNKDSWKTPVHIMAYEGKLEIVQYLIETGAEVEVYDKMKRTPLHNAVESKNLDLVKYLIERKHSVNAKDETEMNALLKSAKLGCLNILKYLIEKGADVNSQDKMKINVLLHAAKTGELKMVKYLIKEQQMDVEYKDVFNITALSWAVQSEKYLPVVKYLVEKAKVNITCKDKNGMSPICHAAKKPNKKMVEYLLGKGCDINAKDNYNTSVLQRIIRWSVKDKWEFVNKIITTSPIKVNFNLPVDKHTPLQKAIQDKRVDIVQFMIKSGASTEKLTDAEKAFLQEKNIS